MEIILTIFLYVIDLFGSSPRLQNFSCYFTCNSFTFSSLSIYPECKLAGKFTLTAKNRLCRTEFKLVGIKSATDRLDWPGQYW